MALPSSDEGVERIPHRTDDGQLVLHVVLNETTPNHFNEAGVVVTNAIRPWHVYQGLECRTAGCVGFKQIEEFRDC